MGELNCRMQTKWGPLEAVWHGEDGEVNQARETLLNTEPIVIHGEVGIQGCGSWKLENSDQSTYGVRCIFSTDTL